MRICIAYYSSTGNTGSVAERLREALAADGHAVAMARFVPADEGEQRAEAVRFAEAPALEGYDGYVFAGPVRAFDISPATAAMMSRLPDLNGRIACCFTTKKLPLNGFGGTRTIGRMVESLEAAGAKVCGTGIVFWGSRKQESQIEDVVSKVRGCFRT